MKEILGLAVFVVLAGAAMWLAISRRASSGFASVVLVFALLSGWTIANYDWIRTAKWEIPGATDTLKRISEAGNASLAELRRESEEKRKSLESLSTAAAGLSEQIAAQRKEIDAIVEDLKAREQKVAASSEKAGLAAEQVAALQRAYSDLALHMIKVVWLQQESKDDYGADRADVAAQELLNQLDEVVKLAISDPDARSKFISGVTNSLPPRQQ